jgi:subtilisin family serine protease
VRICIARRRQLRRASAEELAVNDVWSRGAVVVASAGNDGTNYGAPLYPSGHTNVIAVGTTSEDATRRSTFNAGEWVDVAAPGTYTGTYIYFTLPSS